jgi:hypothetical protein
VELDVQELSDGERSCVVVLEDNLTVLVGIVESDAGVSIFRLDVPVEVPGELTSHVVAWGLGCTLRVCSGCGGCQDGKLKVVHEKHGGGVFCFCACFYFCCVARKRCACLAIVNCEMNI